MPADSTHVKTEKERLAAEFEAGFWEGYEAPLTYLPAYWLAKPVGRLMARERGDLLGRLVRSVERDYP